jgi:acetyl esterase/lipase
MADCLFTVSFIYLILIQFSKIRLRNKYTLIVQFFVAWLIIELAWFHAAVSAVLAIMALGDFDGWSFSTLIGFGLSIFNVIQLRDQHKLGENAKSEFDKTLPIALGDDYLEQIAEERRNQIPTSDYNAWIKPFSFKSYSVETIKSINYGPNARNTLDLHKPKRPSEKPMPVMLQIHGGGWMLGYGDRQGLPLRNKLVEAGWIFVAINYRLSPADKFPAHLIDCKQAVAWIKDNIAEYGGDPDFIMTTGGSAGGHLCSLTALTANQEKELLQPGFEEIDTTIRGSIPVYGVYDFKDRNNHRPDMPITEFLEDMVMPSKLEDDPELWDIASPIAQVSESSPPMMVIHGENDTLSFVEDARFFVKELREKSNQPCVYTELPTAQHAFDIFYSPRCIYAVEAMHTFAEYVYSGYLKSK